MRYFKGKQFKKDIVLVAVGYYCRFSLSYLDISEILKERGIEIIYALYKRNRSLGSDFGFSTYNELHKL
ncbi:hypothetical protein IIC_04492 [Bacillus cereus VD021]|uniref:Transposase for insertion sequence-like element IS431mec n=1 Tax=Bacillus cereus VD021 TaxID=1053224 RepID=R8HDH0_BACCE|nr:hypothetical protein IIC_04492 [Bacillus cereus VD021]